MTMPEFLPGWPNLQAQDKPAKQFGSTFSGRTFHPPLSEPNIHSRLAGDLIQAIVNSLRVRLDDTMRDMV